LLGTLAWAVAEIGFDWWPLVPRGDIIFLLGFYLLMPWVTRGLVRGVDERPPAAWRGAGLPLTGALAIAGCVGVIALSSDRHTQAGTLPGPRAAAQPESAAAAADGDWRAYGGTWHGEKYSPLGQITPANVGNLQVVWTYHIGDIRGPRDPQETTYELTPLKVGDTVYVCTPHDWAIALDAETGREKWKFDPRIDERANLQHLTCRGVSYYEPPAAASAAPGRDCRQRVFLPTADARLFALDAATGKPCQSFGKDGAIDLWTGMADAHAHGGEYYSTSPPAVARNIVIVVGAVTDNYSSNEPSGVVRAFDVNTGALVWNFDSGNPEQTAPIGPGETYTRNSPNSWIVSSVDEGLGMIYIPYGNQTPDQWGGDRGANPERFSSSVTALDIATG
jgi:quinoprotein glucose dehydrogenase